MKILALETSCDETAAAIVTSNKEILANIISSQLAEHSPYGGVVPEIAARSHLNNIESIIKQTMETSGLSFNQLDAVAVTGGPGLIGGVIVGVMVAKAICSVIKKPLIAVNHLEGHALTACLTNEINFPFLVLLVSGGHTQILIVKNIGSYHLIGNSIDDALGESFDKVAKMLGLGYPGGVRVEHHAQYGDPFAYKFPRSMKGRIGCDFSFSGLKTAVKREIDKQEITLPIINDICASFQQTIWDILEDRLINSFTLARIRYPSINKIVIGGGVAANKFLRKNLDNLAISQNMQLIAPPIELCTDNAAMIGWAGIERLKLGMIDDLSFEPRANWPLDSYTNN